MCLLANLTLTELNSMTKTALISEAVKDVRKADAALAHDKTGNAVRMDEEIRDAYGELMGAREILWTYYNTGEVNVITVRDFDAAHRLLGGYTVKHYRGAQQPRLSPIEPGPK